MTAPEPWREEPAPPPPSGKPRDPCERADRAGASEFSWGPGLVPPKAYVPSPSDQGLFKPSKNRQYNPNGRPPNDGGKYMPQAPPVELASPGSVIPRQKRRPRGEVRGYPGERVQ